MRPLPGYGGMPSVLRHAVDGSSDEWQSGTSFASPPRTRLLGCRAFLMELCRSSPREPLVAYLTANHELLVPLLPPDTTCADIFGEVADGRPIAGFFNPTEDPALAASSCASHR